MTDPNDIKLKIENGLFTTEKRISRSEIYNIFYNIMDGKKLIKNFMFCTRCKNVYKYNEKCTSNLLRHSCFKKFKSSKVVKKEKLQPTTELKKKCTELVIQWTVLNCRPFNITNDEGLINLLEFCVKSGDVFGGNLDVNSLMPHSATVSQNISSLYEEQRQILKDELNTLKDVGFSITCDTWTDDFLKSSYVGFTVHYVKDGFISHKILGMVEIERSTETNIRTKINELLMEFDCELNDKVAIVTAEGANLKTAFQEDRNIFCINHLLNNVIEKAISDTIEVENLTIVCSELVKYLRKTDDLNSTLNTSTKWNKNFYLLKSIQENWDDITPQLEDKHLTNRLENFSLSNINDIVNVLKPFEEATKLLQGEEYPTIHQVYPQISRLKTLMRRINSTDLEFIQVFKGRLLHHMEMVIDANITDFHKIGLFLFPPANKLSYFKRNEKDHIHKSCREMLKMYENSEYILNEIWEPTKTEDAFMDFVPDNASSNFVPDNASSNFVPDNASSDFVPDDAFSDFVQVAVDPDCNDELHNEIMKYESPTILYYKEFDSLEWWKVHKKEYPLLYKLSSFVLATPATSAPSERLFSKARHLLIEKRSILEKNPSMANQIMFLHCNLDLSNLDDYTNNLNTDMEF